MMPQLFIDLDGVLGDFYGHYYQRSGCLLTQHSPEPVNLWSNIRHYGDFYRTQPLCKDAMELWNGAKEIHPHPIILSGVPYSIPGVAVQKRGWVDQHLGRDVTLICCRSIDKKLYARPGDILVDDREKYKSHWIEMGGIWVTHSTAKKTLLQLRTVYAKNNSNT